MALAQPAIETIERLEVRVATLYSQGKYAEALEPAREALKLREQQYGPDSFEASLSHAALAKLYDALGRYYDEFPHLKRALAIREVVCGPDDLAVAVSQNRLGSLMLSMGRFSRAMELQNAALRTLYRQPRAMYREFAVVQHDIGLIYLAQGDLIDAQREFEVAYDYMLASKGPDDPGTLRTATQLAIVEARQWRLEQAQARLTAILESYERQPSADPLAMATALDSQAQLYQQMGDIDSALGYARRALEMREKQLGRSHPETAVALAHYAVALNWVQRDQEAESLLREALKSLNQGWGRENPETVSAASNLASLLAFHGRYEEALPLERKVLEIRMQLWKRSPEVTTSYNNLATALLWTGEPAQALVLQEQAVKMALDLHGPGSREASLYHNNLALVRLANGDRGGSLLAARLASDHLAALAREVFSFASEPARIAFVDDLDPYAVLAALEQPELLLREALRYKSVVLDSVLEDRRIQAAGGEGVRRTFTITPKEVQAVLPQDTALVEWIRYTGFLPGKEGQLFHPDAREIRYGALILSRDQPVRWVPLAASGADIERLVAESQKLMRGHRVVRAGEDGQLLDDEATSRVVLRDLYDRLWAPIEPDLAGRRVVLSPDGALNTVSFATLLTPQQRFLGEETTLLYVSSGRDLLAPPSPSTRGEALLIGNPDYGATSGDASGARGAAPTAFSPLPYTAVECEAVASVLARRGQRVRTLLGEQADKKALLGLERAPEVLHLATHGYLHPGSSADPPDLWDQDRARRVRGDTLESLDHSGLALAGAGSGSGGLLTAREACLLPLQGTRLVVLSACDSGLGTVGTNNGVVGLRRGFAQAGARNLVMTLWPVADQETSEFMTEFYQRLESLPPALALAQVQGEWLRRWRERGSVTEAAVLAGPFVATFTGAVPSGSSGAEKASAPARKISFK